MLFRSNELLHIAVATPVFKSWSAADQQIARACAQQAATEMTAGLRKVEATEVEAMRANGVDVVDIPREQLIDWQTPARRVYARWKAMTNPALVTKVEQIVAASAAKR